MSYQTPTFLAAEHAYRTERLTRSWGPLRSGGQRRGPVRRRRHHTVPMTTATPALLGTGAPAMHVDTASRVDEAAVTDYRERTLVGLR